MPYIICLRGYCISYLKISMFCGLSQNNQHLKNSICYHCYSKLFKELKKGIGILVGQAIFKLMDQNSQNV